MTIRKQDCHSKKAEIIVALDEPSLRDAERLMDILEGRVLFYKVGLQLFAAAGEAGITAILRRRAKVFLDLKLHDIPNTVAAAVRAVRNLGVDLCTIHLSGGSEMCSAAVAESGSEMKIIGVTVLTNFDQTSLASNGVRGTIGDHVIRLARVGKASGVRGFVSSAQELPLLRAELPQSTLFVTPGIRPMDAATGDQRRTSTPVAAVRAGATHLVVGRPISRAEDPAAAFDRIANEISVGFPQPTSDEPLD